MPSRSATGSQGAAATRVIDASGSFDDTRAAVVAAYAEAVTGR